MTTVRRCAEVLLGLAGAVLIAVGAFFVLARMDRALSPAVYFGIPLLLSCLTGAGIRWVCDRPRPSESPRSNTWWITGALTGLIGGGVGLMCLVVSIAYMTAAIALP